MGRAVHDHGVRGADDPRVTFQEEVRAVREGRLRAAGDFAQAKTQLLRHQPGVRNRRIEIHVDALGR